jgi:translation initiation factor 1
MSDDAPFHNPFGALGKLRDSLPERPATAGPERPVAPAPPQAAAKAAKPTGPARAVVRMERSGRGGKEVTVIDQLGIPPIEREKWLKALKASLGCGGVVEEDRLVLQGDHRKRLPDILAARGVRKIIVG